jgi:small ligand-binding sensory domain FIST
MHWVSVVGDGSKLESSLEPALAELQTGLGDKRLDLLFVFPSKHHLFDFGRVLPTIRRSLGNVPVVGASTEACVGAGLEMEGAPAVSLLGAHLPEAEILVRHLRNSKLPPLDGSPRPWRDLIGIDPAERPDFIVLADPYSTESFTLLQGLDYAYPSSTIVGGLVSGGAGPGAQALFHPGGVEAEGALVVAFRGDLSVESLVSQGCRPVGEPARVSECEGHLLKSLDGRPPHEFLRDLFEESSEEDQRLLQHALQLGVLVNEARTDFHRGDFLIRNIVGMQQGSGVMAVGSELRPGQTVRFHVRDSSTAAHDLRARLRRTAHRDLDRVGGALQFSCVGRGTRLFGDPHHDARAIQEFLGPLPAAGMFCNGEIGPVAGSTYVHGFSVALALFRSRS